MKWIVTVLLVLFFRTGLIAQPIDVGLFQDQLVKAAVVYCSSGYYQLLLDGEVIKRMEEGDILYLNLEEGMVKVLDSERDFGLASNVELRSLSTEGVIRVRCISPEIGSRVYDDNLLPIPSALTSKLFFPNILVNILISFLMYSSFHNVFFMIKKFFQHFRDNPGIFSAHGFVHAGDTLMPGQRFDNRGNRL